MRECKDFFEFLEIHKGELTKQQYKTIRGQAIAGNITGAKKGLARLLKRKGGVAS